MKIRHFYPCIVFMITVGCSQTAHQGTTYYKTVTTWIDINTNVPSEVLVADRTVGTTPLSFPFSYQEEVTTQVTTANYWETNPGTAAALSILSYGLYVPFSFIPVEPKTDTVPTQKYANNSLVLRLVAEKYDPLDYVLECRGEGKIVLNLSLTQNKGEEK